MAAIAEDAVCRFIFMAYMYLHEMRLILAILEEP